MSTATKPSPKGVGSKRRSRNEHGVGESDDHSTPGVAVPESPDGSVARCELCLVLCSTGPRLRSKKTGAYRHRQCPDQATVTDMLRAERRAVRVAARGVDVTPSPDTKTSSSRPSRQPDSGDSRGRKSVRWVDRGATSDDDGEGVTPGGRSSKQTRNRADEGPRSERFSDDDENQSLYDEHAKRVKTESSSRRRKLKNQSGDASEDDAEWSAKKSGSRSNEPPGVRYPRSEATRKHAREKHKKHKDAFDDLLDSGAEIFSILFNRYTTWHTPVYLISLCVLYTVSKRVPVSAAVATVGLTASVAAVLGGAGVSFNSFSSFSIPNFGKLVLRETTPAVKVCWVLLSWTLALFQRGLVFVFRSLQILVVASHDLWKTLCGFARAAHDTRSAVKRVSARGALGTSSYSENKASKSESVDAWKEVVPTQDAPKEVDTTLPTSNAPGALAWDTNRRLEASREKWNETEERETRLLTETKALNDELRELQETQKTHSQDMKLLTLELAETKDELVVARSELSASRADADAARRGREGAVERATHATVLSTRAENAEQIEIMERLLADTRVEMKTSVIESAAEARRVASDEHARLREKNRELVSQLAESDHLSNARDALEQASRAKVTQLTRHVTQLAIKHNAEMNLKTEGFELAKRAMARKLEEQIEDTRDACAKEIDTARRETARELTQTSTACAEECKRLRLVKERVERDWRLASDRADAAETEAASTLEAARMAETFLGKSSKKCEALESLVAETEKDKNSLWERLEYAEWRLQKLGLGGAEYTQTEMHVAARRGGSTDRERREGDFSAKTLEKRASANDDSGVSVDSVSCSTKNPGPSADDDEETIGTIGEGSPEGGRSSVKSMAASFESQTARRSEAQALMRRVRLMEPGDGNKGRRRSVTERVDTAM